MPGKRAKNKVRFGGYLERDLYNEIVELANSEGMGHDKFGFLKRLLREALTPAMPAASPLPRNGQIAPAKVLTDPRGYGVLSAGGGQPG
jgi:hypothetical protein